MPTIMIESSAFSVILYRGNCPEWFQMDSVRSRPVAVGKARANDKNNGGNNTCECHHEDTVAARNAFDSTQKVAFLIAIADVLHDTEQFHEQSAGHTGSRACEQNRRPHSQWNRQLTQIGLRGILHLRTRAWMDRAYAAAGISETVALPGRLDSGTIGSAIFGRVSILPCWSGPRNDAGR